MPQKWPQKRKKDQKKKKKELLLRSSFVVQQIKDPALSLRWRRFDPWPGNFYMVQAQPKKKE